MVFISLSRSRTLIALTTFGSKFYPLGYGLGKQKHRASGRIPTLTRRSLAQRSGSRGRVTGPCQTPPGARSDPLRGAQARVYFPGVASFAL